MKSFEMHPIALFTYFCSIIFITMLSLNPITIAISLFSSIFFCGTLIGAKKLVKSLLYSLPIFLTLSIANPIFVHKGETILFFLNDNPFTMEALIYGVVSAIMIIAVFYWFKCYDIIMTSDKFIYLFGKVIPKISLLLSMILRFAPKFKQQFSIIDDSQKALGIYASKSFVDIIKNKIRVISILITWSLESSIETANSMRSRGYGLKGRSSYSNYKWTKRDTTLCILIWSLSIFIIINIFLKTNNFVFYPALTTVNLSILSIAFYIGLFLLMTLPTLLEIKEIYIWRYLKSKI